MPGVRFLSLFAVVFTLVTLVAARVAFAAGAPSPDRAELPGDDNDGSSGGAQDTPDGSDLTLPSRATTTWAAVLTVVPCAFFEESGTPATSTFASRIFRPPISALA